MLWLAGLMGLMAISAAAYVDIGGDDAEADGAPEPQPLAQDGFNLMMSSQSQSSDIPQDGAENTISKALAVGEHLANGGAPDAYEALPEESDSIAAVDISDFEAEDDSLLFIWDDSTGESEPPHINILADPENDGQLQVWLDDDVVAQVSGQSTLTEADISLIPLSSAIELELVDS
ncbi:MAG: hypothetical protein AB8B60_19810 [Sulfitobacter sp.]